MTKNKPESIEELEVFIAEHADDGKINGEEVVPADMAEWRGGFLPGDLYNKAILCAAPFGFNKTQVVQYAFVGLIKVLDLGVVPSRPFYENARSEYRGFLPSGIFAIAQEYRDTLQLTNAEMMQLAIHFFANDPWIQARYRIFEEKLMAKHGCDRERIEQAIYGAARLRARRKRYQLSVEKGEFVSDRKIAD